MSLGGRAAALAALAATTLWISSAQAAIVTLGPRSLPSSAPGTYRCGHGECPGNETFAQFDPSDVAPAAGLITSWGVTGSGRFELRVLEPVGNAIYAGAGTSAIATSTNGEANSTELPIERGDRIGVDPLEYIPGQFAPSEVGAEIDPAAELIWWNPPVGEGEDRGVNGTHEGYVLLVNAQEELEPVIDSVSPDSGSASGGDTVTITGKYLDSALDVVFGSRPATTFSADASGERITAVTPASSAGTVDVHVSTLHLTSETVAADRYTFIAPPASPGGSTSSPPAASTSAPSGGGSRQGSATPVVTGFRQSNARWRRGGSLPHISSVPVGTTFSFTLNEPASVALTFIRVSPGRRAGGECVAPSPRNRSNAKCKRNTIAGSLAVAGHAGVNKVAFQGRLSRTRQLAAGSYTAIVTASDGHGLKKLSRPLSFTALN